MSPIIRAAVTLAVLCAVIALVLVGYQYAWVGFAAHKAPVDGEVPMKTLWDWLDLLIVPIVLSAGAFLLDGSRKRAEARVENDRQRQETLEEYIAYISKLLIEHGLSTARSSAEVVSEVARTRTLTALRALDGNRKAQVLQFLYEAKLILSPRPVIVLRGADFSGSQLDQATLLGAELRGAYFTGASFREAILVGADLRGSDFTSVNFEKSDLTGARLAQATLDGADLSNVDLKGVDLASVNLRRAVLSDAQRAQHNP